MKGEETPIIAPPFFFLNLIKLTLVVDFSRSGREPAGGYGKEPAQGHGPERPG